MAVIVDVAHSVDGSIEAKELIDEVGQEPVAEADEDAAEIIDEFKDFIENVSPEDFE